MSCPWEIHHGDVRRVCKTLEAKSFDAVLCDPPYGLSFMGRRWDYSVPSAMVWSEIERVMKPGAHAMIFGGSRTFHRLACAVEDAGFEIRDVLMWLYGSGFPKSFDVSKGIDDALGHKRTEVIGTKKGTHAALGGTAVGVKQKQIDVVMKKPASELASRWQGYGSALKPAYEPVLLVRRFPDGTLAENALAYETGALAIDASRIGVTGGTAGHQYEKTGLFGIGGKATIEQLDVGRWPANVLISHHENCECVGTRASRDKTIKTVSTGEVVSSNRSMGGPNYGRSVVGTSTRPDEEVWRCVEGCPVRTLDEQSGQTTSNPDRGRRGRGGLFAKSEDGVPCGPQYGDAGGASRFFYTPKADRFQRNSGCESLPKKVAQGVGALRDHGRGSDRANIHPTVKPIDLIRYLARMILPPKRDTPRRILVPFSGSGSEMIGCLQAGWDEVVGIEREAEYIEIAKARISKGGVLSKLMKMRAP